MSDLFIAVIFVTNLSRIRDIKDILIDLIMTSLI